MSSGGDGWVGRPTDPSSQTVSSVGLSTAQIQLVTPPVIEARGLVRRFGSLVAVDGLDLEVRRGEVFGFLGPNGAGKSTTIRMLVGLLDPSEGHIKVLDRDMPRQAEELRPHMGYMTQRFSLYDELSVEENLDFAAEIFGIERARRRRLVARAIEEFGLGERRQQRPATLSGGWKQRLALAVATVHSPEILLLDEPTAGVDPDSRRLFWAKLFEIARQGTTILVSTHYMDEAIRCHRLCVIREGRRAALGRPVDLVGALAGRVVEVGTRTRDAETAIACLEARPEVASVAQLGNRLHVLLAPGIFSQPSHLIDLQKALQTAGVRKASLAGADPNLEDVFVALSQGEHLGAELGSPGERS